MSGATSTDPFDLHRFVTAQAGVIDQALAELSAGRKRSHWMWFIFPQLKGLGRSSTAERFGVASLEEARAYLAHPLLGFRLKAATAAAAGSPARTAHDLFGPPDDLKFRASMTLFDAADPAGPWSAALARFSLTPDPATLALLKR